VSIHHIIIQGDIVRQNDVQLHDLVELLELGVYRLPLVVRPAQLVIVVPGQLSEWKNGKVVVLATRA